MNLHGCIIDSELWKKKCFIETDHPIPLTTIVILTILTKNVTDAHMPLNDIGISSIIYPGWPSVWIVHRPSLKYRVMPNL